MANSFGGYILFGITDAKVAVATPDIRIVGIPRSSELRKEFADKLRTVQRDIYFDVKTIDIPGAPEKCVLVVYVPTSQLRPHVDVATGIFWTRGEGGSAKRLDCIGVRDQMLYTEGRLQKITRLRFELPTIFEVSKMLINLSTSSVRFDVGAYKVLLADVCDMLQADTGLLELLHAIGSGAGILNSLLDATATSWAVQQPSSWAINQRKLEAEQEVNNRLGKLFNLCGQAQTRLAALFGPLKTS